MQRSPSGPGRRSNGPRAVIEYGPIAALAKKASALGALDRALRQTLPMPLREQVRFANLRAGRLIFLAPTSAWAARLRLMQTKILDSARAIGVNAYAVAVKVAPL
ncbi:MAG: DciA family protein, partial [Dyella sp.]